MSQAIRVLKETQRILADESCWTQGFLAKDRNGNMCHPFYSQPKCRCLYGALLTAAHWINKNNDEALGLALEAIHKTLGFNNIVAWNDVPERTYEEVRDLLIRTVALEESNEKS